MFPSFPRRTWLVAALLLLPASLASGASDKAATADKYLPRLEKILNENIAPFWYDKSIDRAHGGYLIDFDTQGRRKSRATKMIVTQARTLWLFSRLARAGHRRDECLDAANVGYRFLTEKMWDAEHGGFYWEVDVTGEKQLKPDKHLYGQSFALYALSEYYRAGEQTGGVGLRRAILRPAGSEGLRQHLRRLSREFRAGLDRDAGR